VKIIWIGIDDTDSRSGGCTTHVALAIILKLIEDNYDIIGYPRLVRLNPNIPWKTRGNGAISLQIGKGIGKKTKIGEANDSEIFCYFKGSSDKYNESDIEKIKSIVEEILEKYAKIDDENTNPGFAILQKQPSINFYERTVRDVVTLKETQKVLDSITGFYKGYKNCRGVIGATASISWPTDGDKTYELIAYRQEKKIGTERNIDGLSVKKMDEKCKTTFDNYDYENKHNRLTPSSPCPVLFGIRGDDEKELIYARTIVKSESAASWLIFISNQGTDDHLQKKNIDEIQPYQSAIIEGVISKNPYTIKGGHVILTVKDQTGTVDCAAYEPTKQFKNIVRQLNVGDVAEFYGGVRKKPITINIEKMNIKKLVNINEKVENPICPKCGKHMKSKGTNQGFKCKICGLKNDNPIMREKKRNISTGLYETPVCARRHLSKPMKRMT